MSDSYCEYGETEMHDETKCLDCGKKKSKEEIDCGHDFCFECFAEHND